jgi:hypothetical protein
MTSAYSGKLWPLSGSGRRLCLPGSALIIRQARRPAATLPLLSVQPAPSGKVKDAVDREMQSCLDPLVLLRRTGRDRVIAMFEMREQYGHPGIELHGTRTLPDIYQHSLERLLNHLVTRRIAGGDRLLLVVRSDQRPDLIVGRERNHFR